MTDTTEMGGGDVIALVDPSRWDHPNAPQLAYAYGHNDAVKALSAQPSAGAQEIVWVRSGADVNGDPLTLKTTFGDMDVNVVKSRGTGLWNVSGYILGKMGVATEAEAVAYAEDRLRSDADRRVRAAHKALALYATPAQPVDIVPSHCTGTALSFDPGVLQVNKDGSGYIAIDEVHFSLEDDRAEGPDGPEGSVHWITRLDASEMVALRDFLTASTDTGGWIVGNADDTQWRTWDDFGCSTWTDDRDKATRYHRREDAELVHREDEDAWRITPYGQPDTGDVAALQEALVETLSEWFDRIPGFEDTGNGTIRGRYPHGFNDVEFDHIALATDILAALSKPNAPGAR